MDESTEKHDKHYWAERLRDHLETAKRLRPAAGTPQEYAERMAVREWQAQRLARTHGDLLEHRRFAAAARFFLTDLYGPKDFSRRDDEVTRIIPTLTALLPASAIRTIAGAVELDALSEALDIALLQELRNIGPVEPITDEAYALAYRRCGNCGERLHQLELVVEVGHAMDKLTRLPFIGTALKLMRAPAHAAGLGELQEFLERGFSAFKSMGRADEFLRLVEERERALAERLFGGARDPFSAR